MANRLKAKPAGGAKAADEPDIDPELAKLYAETDVILDQDVDATRSMVKEVDEMENTANKTSVELNRQGEALDRTAAREDEINEDLKSSERTLTAMEKFCGLCSCPCWDRRRSASDKAAERKAFEGKNKYAAGTQVQTAGERLAVQQPKASTGGRMTENFTGDDREEEINDNLKLVHQGVGRLKIQAGVISEQLDENMDKEKKLLRRTDVQIRRVDKAGERAAILAGASPGPRSPTAPPHMRKTKV